MTTTINRLRDLPALPSPEPAAAPAGLRMVRIDEVCNRVGLSRSSLWRMAKEEKFPPPRRLAGHAVGGLEPEIDAWLKSRKVVYAQDGPQPRTRRR